MAVGGRLKGWFPVASKYEPLHIAAEVDVDNQLWAGIADYQGAPHLFLSELLDLDQPRARRRLGQTFFLIAITPRDLRAILKEWRASALRFDGDPTWKQKQRCWEKAWANFKRKQIQQAVSAWRIRGSFRAPTARNKDIDQFRWTLLRKTPVTGDQVRTRLARIAELLPAASCTTASVTRGEETPF